MRPIGSENDCCKREGSRAPLAKYCSQCGSEITPRPHASTASAPAVGKSLKPWWLVVGFVGLMAALLLVVVAVSGSSAGSSRAASEGQPASVLDSCPNMSSSAGALYRMGIGYTNPSTGQRRSCSEIARTFYARMNADRFQNVDQLVGSMDAGMASLMFRSLDYATASWLKEAMQELYLESANNDI